MSNKIERPNLSVSNLKRLNLEDEKRPNKNGKIITFKVKLLINIASCAEIFPEQALKYNIFINIQKGQKRATWQNHFVSFNKHSLVYMAFKKPNGNHK